MPPRRELILRPPPDADDADGQDVLELLRELLDVGRQALGILQNIQGIHLAPEHLSPPRLAGVAALRYAIGIAIRTAPGPFMEMAPVECNHFDCSIFF